MNLRGIAACLALAGTLACSGRVASHDSEPHQNADAGSGGGVQIDGDVPMLGWHWTVLENGAEALSGSSSPNEPLHYVFDDLSPHIDISTHQHFDLTQAKGVEFVARASRPTEMMVSVTPILASDFWTDLANGFSWQAAVVAVGTESERFFVAFSDLEPAGPGTPRPLSGPPENPGTMLHFMLTDASNLQIWFDEIWVREN